MLRSLCISGAALAAVAISTLGAGAFPSSQAMKTDKEAAPLQQVYYYGGHYRPYYRHYGYYGYHRPYYRGYGYSGYHRPYYRGYGYRYYR